MDKIFLDLSRADGAHRGFGDNKDAVDSAVEEMEEPLLTSGVDGLSKPSYPVLGEGLK